MLTTSKWTSRRISEAIRPVSKFCRFFTFQVNDRVLIEERREGRRDDIEPKLSRPLRPDGVHGVYNGSLQHSDIIGKRERDELSIKKSHFRLIKPTLEDYITGISRAVTPIYPQDANVIVSQLDLHVGPPGSAHESEAPLEIFEAGTGHGALTLYLARAIHAANSAAPKADIGHQGANEDGNTPRILSASETDMPGPAPFPESWRAQRKAVIHTLDINQHYSITARRNVRCFGRGIYAGNVDFYVGTIPEWFKNQQSLRSSQTKDEPSGMLPEWFNKQQSFRFSQAEGESSRPFLSHGILDLPGCDKYLELVAEHLHVGGKLLVFCPSITQLIACNQMVRRSKLPLHQEKVIELGMGFSGGRHWDVRAFKPRAVSKAEQMDTADASELETSSVDRGSPEELDNRPGESNDDAGYEMICRPMAGKRVFGGGFLGVWTKMKWSPGKSLRAHESGNHLTSR